MSATDRNSSQSGRARESADRYEPLQAPLRVHAYLWVFMVTLSVSPFLYLLATRESIERGDWIDAFFAAVLIQAALWIVQRRCSSKDLSYWDGLLVATASVTRRIGPTSLLAFPVLLLTVAASFVFAVGHGDTPLHHASIRFCRLIIGIHKRRLN
jgi:hypothetical protein